MTSSSSVTQRGRRGGYGEYAELGEGTAGGGRGYDEYNELGVLEIEKFASNFCNLKTGRKEKIWTQCTNETGR
jgi:hypothetical protein